MSIPTQATKATEPQQVIAYDRDGLWYWSGSSTGHEWGYGWRSPLNPPLSLMVQEAKQFDAARVFVHPSAMAMLGLPEKLDGKKAVPHRFVDMPARPRGLFPAIVADGVRVDFLAYGDSPLARAPDARSLLRSLSLFLETIGIPWGRGPGDTVENLIREVHPFVHGGVQIRRPAVPLPEPACNGATENPYTWIRNQSLTETTQPFVHVFDMNGQYLAAWSSLVCGISDLVHVEGTMFPFRSGSDEKKDGYWRLADEIIPVLRRGNGSAQFRPPPIVSGSGAWVHTETLCLLRENGVTTPVVEAWVSERGSRYLSPAYERLRDARETLLLSESAGADIALAMVKRCYQIAHGRFGASFRFRAPDPFLRPSWRHGIIARARCNLYRRLQKLTQLPFAIDVDALAFATDEARADVFAQSIGLPIGTRLGEFKVRAFAPNSEAIQTAKTSRAVMKLVEEDGV